jgi:hypothetical protein
LIAEAANYALDREKPIEPPPAALAPRLIAEAMFIKTGHRE